MVMSNDVMGISHFPSVEGMRASRWSDVWSLLGYMWGSCCSHYPGRADGRVSGRGYVTDIFLKLPVNPVGPARVSAEFIVVIPNMSEI